MLVRERELLVARVLSGSVRVRAWVAGRQMAFVLRQPSRDRRYEAEEVYEEALADARFDGLFDAADLEQFRFMHRLWDGERQALLDGLAKDIESLKVGLYENAFRRNEQARGRAALKIAREKQAELSAQLHAYDHLTAEGAAGMARIRYLAAASLLNLDGTAVIPQAEFGQGHPLVDTAVELYLGSRLDESTFRELARTDPWRTIWGARSSAGAGVFGAAAADLSEEQLSLQAWSQTYDNVAEHPEGPPQEVVEDDDMLDGWFILQRRERKQKDREKKKADAALTNEKIRNSGEVFIVAQTDEDAREIDALNDPAAAMVKAQRMAAIRSRGTVQEAEMPDTKISLAMQRNRLMAEAAKRK